MASTAPVFPKMLIAPEKSRSSASQGRLGCSPAAYRQAVSGWWRWPARPPEPKYHSGCTKPRDGMPVGSLIFLRLRCFLFLPLCCLGSSSMEKSRGKEGSIILVSGVALSNKRSIIIISSFFDLFGLANNSISELKSIVNFH